MTMQCRGSHLGARRCNTSTGLLAGDEDAGARISMVRVSAGRAGCGMLGFSSCTLQPRAQAGGVDGLQGLEWLPRSPYTRWTVPSCVGEMGPRYSQPLSLAPVSREAARSLHPRLAGDMLGSPL